MTKRIKRNFTPEFRLEAALLVVEQTTLLQKPLMPWKWVNRQWTSGFVNSEMSAMAEALKQPR